MRVNSETYDYIFDGDEEGFIEVENGDWQVEHKCESKRVVVQHVESGNYYALHQTRYGSYWQGYEYEENYDTDAEGMIELEQVFPREVTIIEYV